MHEALAILGRHALLLLGAERLLIEIDGIGGAPYCEIRAGGLHLGRCCRPGWHFDSPWLRFAGPLIQHRGGTTVPLPERRTGARQARPGNVSWAVALDR